MSLVNSFVPRTLVEAWQRTEPGAGEECRIVGEGSALVWVDIEAFTTIANAAVANGSDGIESLSRFLDRHYDRVIRLVSDWAGDSLAFCGDGLLVGFHAPNGSRECCERAMQFGSELVSGYNLKNDDGNPVGLHVHVVSDSWQLCEVGAADRRHCIAIGPALETLKKMADRRMSGHLVACEQSVAWSGYPSVKKLAANCHAVAAKSDKPFYPPRPLPLPALNALNAYLPVPVRHRINNDTLDWCAELRRVSIVFLCLPELRHDSPDAIRGLHELTCAVNEIVAGAGGVIAQIVVDDKGASLLIYFGVPPLAQTDDPGRAVATALAVREAVKSQGQVCGVGVTTGMAFCGVIGNDLRRDYTVIGDVVNLAARLMHSSYEEVRCDTSTQLAAAASFDFDVREPLAVKGMANKVAVVSPTAKTKTVQRRNLASRLVGRDAEVSAFREDFTAVLAGKQRLRLITGEPGSGKTVLGFAAAQMAESVGFSVLVANALEVSQEIPYQSLQLLLLRLLGISAEASPVEQREQLFRTLGPSLSDYAALFNAVLDLGIEDGPVVSKMSGQQRSSATRELLIQLILKITATKPTLLLLEDGHWFDASSWALVLALITNRQPLAIILTGRATVDASAPEYENYNAFEAAGAIRMSLAQLTVDGCRELLRRQLKVAVSDEIVDFVFARSQGSPVYIEELARELVFAELVQVRDGQAEVAGGVDLASSGIPESILAMITHRVDRMDVQAQLSLKVESVIGHRGSLAAVGAVHPLPLEAEAIKGHVGIQQQLGLVHAAQISEGDGFEFSHDLVRGAVYSLMLSTQRRELHARAARWLESLESSLPNLLYLLGHHWELAGYRRFAADYLEQEAVRVALLGYSAEGLGVGLRAGQLLSVDLPTDAASTEAALNETLAALAGAIPSQVRKLPELRDKDVARQLLFLQHICPLAHQVGNMPLFALIAARGLELILAHGISNEAAENLALYSIVHTAFTGDRKGASEWSELALEIAEQKAGRAFASAGFICAYFHHHWVGPLPEVLPLVRRAAESGMANDNIQYGCYNLAQEAITLQVLGRPLVEVIACSDRNRREVGNQVLSPSFHLLLERQFARALSGKTEALRSFSDKEVDEKRDVESIFETGLVNQMGYFCVARLKLHLLCGDWQEACDWGGRCQQYQEAIAGQTAEFEQLTYAALAMAGRALFNQPGADVGDTAENIRISLQQLLENARLCPANFRHKALMVDAAVLALEQDSTSALLRLDEADVAITSDYLHDRIIISQWRQRLLELMNIDISAAAVETERLIKLWGATALLRS